MGIFIFQNESLFGILIQTLMDFIQKILEIAGIYHFPENSFLTAINLFYS